MTNFRNTIKLLLGGCIGVLASCSPSDTSTVTDQNFERPVEVWVTRSVLDSQIRMLSIALNEKLWVAYHTENGAFYKAWTGGVKVAGPVYGRGGGQPVSRGNTFLQEPDGNPWVIIAGGAEVTPEINYKGHTLLNKQVKLKYELVYQGNSIEIEERPEYYKLPGDQVGLERFFETRDVPPGVQVGLKVRLSSIVSEDDYQTNGSFVVDKREAEEVSGKQFKQLAGTLILNSNDKTVFSLKIAPKPVMNEEVEEKGEEEIALTMMADHGCATCHNRNEKAVGPSFWAIAQRYRNNMQNLEELVGKVIKGGAGNWGEVPMIPHTELPESDAETLVTYILNLDANQERQLAQIMPESEHSFLFHNSNNALLNSKGERPGIAFNIYQLDYELYGFPQITGKAVPQQSGFVNMLHAYNEDFENSFKDFNRNFAIQASGFLNLKADSRVEFRLASNDGTRLFIDGKMVVETVGNMAAVKEGSIFLKAGKHPFLYEYYKRGGEKRFSLQWRHNGTEEYTAIPPEVFTFEPSDIKIPKAKPASLVARKQTSPGDGAPLKAMHPAFDLAQARPESFQPKVAGMDFMPDGRLVISTWDSLGAVYILDGVQGNDPGAIKVKRVAAGLAEPLGLKVVDGEIFVLQKQELTKLVDLDNDGVADEYQTVCNSWTSTDNHHEFSFGLAYKDGYFYGTLSVAIKGGGPSAPDQAPDRGKAFKISKEDGSITFVANGLRTPNGIGFGVDNELFIADNQGDWLPANKIVHLQQGAFYGNRSVIDYEGKADLTETLPVVYLEHDQIGNSPSQPARLDIGPYKNQMIHGDVTHGGIKRVFAEKVNGAYQGAVFRFMQGLEAGVNRLIWGPDGALYVGGVGNGGNWEQHGKLRYGLQKLTFNSQSAFEMLAIRAMPNGIEIEFTEPLKEGAGSSPSDYNIRQWWYKPTANYGGPNLDEEDLAIKSIKVSADRKKVTLELPGMKEKHVVYMRLNRETMLNANNQQLWTTESWYTMNSIPGKSQQNAGR